MDWLTFIAEIIKGLAWPAVVLTLLLVLRRPIADLLPLVRKLRYKEFEAQFGARLEEVETLKAETAPALPEPAAPAQPGEPPGAFRRPSTDVLSLALQLAEKSPRAAILEAWLGVESAAKSAVKRLGLVAITPRSLLDVIRTLDKSNALDAAQIAMLHELRSLRNDAAHSAEVALSTETAIRYVALAESLKEHLDALGRTGG
jgi:hypothetical protein